MTPLRTRVLPQSLLVCLAGGVCCVSIALGACAFDAYDIRLAPRDAATPDVITTSDVTATPVDARSCVVPSPVGCGRVRLAGGTYAMGDARAYDYGNSDGYVAQPAQRMITVSAFTLDRFEVSVGRFRRYVEAMGAPTGLSPRVADGLHDACNWTPAAADREAHPLNCVDWSVASAFCAWDVDGGRLPSEAEWEFAARGTTQRPWPWGDGAFEPPAWVCWNRSAPTALGTCALDDETYTMGRTPEGLAHLIGNVWEWTGDWYQRYARTTCWGDRAQTSPLCNDPSSGQRTIRGGSWYLTFAAAMQTGARDRAEPTHRASSIGFRCAAP